MITQQFDDRRWHIFKDVWPPDKPWHVELTRAGAHCPSPNDPHYAAYADACLFVRNHVIAAERRQQQREQREAQL